MKTPLRALIFDLDDTLLVDEEVSQETLKAVAAHVGASSQLKQEAFATTVRVVAKRHWQEGPCHPFCHAIGISAMECLWGNFLGESEKLHALRAWALQYREQVFQEVLEDQKVSSQELEKKSKECAALFVQERRARQRLFPDVAPLLQELSQQYHLGLLTNGAPDLQREKLAPSGLEKFFSVVIISGEHGIGKPKPVIFEKMLEQLGVTASEVIMIGNSLERDIAGARAAGIRSVWIDLGDAKEKSDVQPDFRITELSELLPILREERN
ncbi:MAG: HAD family hydrolase [Verrucomicrobia bacterium]|nr:MAG: HAD family hydrolase [Verrucomicrobiota bacterium]